MAKLTVNARDALKGSSFAGPGRSFPIENKNHAEAALIDVGKAKGLSAAEKDTIRKKAKAKLDGKNQKDLDGYMKKTYGDGE